MFLSISHLKTQETRASVNCLCVDREKLEKRHLRSRVLPESALFILVGIPTSQLLLLVNCNHHSMKTYSLRRHSPDNRTEQLFVSLVCSQIAEKTAAVEHQKDTIAAGKNVAKFVTLLLPGYLPPRFLLMRQTMSRTRSRKMMAHIIPMNHPADATFCVTGSAIKNNARHYHLHHTYGLHHKCYQVWKDVYGYREVGAVEREAPPKKGSRQHSRNHALL